MTEQVFCDADKHEWDDPSDSLTYCLACNISPSQAKAIKELYKRDWWLTCLESAGVDNWSGFEVAQEILDEDGLDMEGPR